LRGIRHKRVRQTHLYYLFDKVSRFYNAGVCYHGQAFIVAYAFDKFYKVGVLHLLADPCVTEQAAEDRKACMQGVKAGADLHFFNPVYGFPVRKKNSCFFKDGFSVGKIIFYNEVLGFLGVYKRGDVGVL